MGHHSNIFVAHAHITPLPPLLAAITILQPIITIPMTPWHKLVLCVALWCGVVYCIVVCCFVVCCFVVWCGVMCCFVVKYEFEWQKSIRTAYIHQITNGYQCPTNMPGMHSHVSYRVLPHLQCWFLCPMWLQNPSITSDECTRESERGIKKADYTLQTPSR